MSELRANRLSMIGRCLLLLVAVACLVVQPQSGENGNPRIVVLIDQSDSVPRATAEQARRELADDLQPLAGVLEATESVYGDASSMTSVASAVRAALWTLQPGSRNGIVVISDGHWSAGSVPLLEQARTAQVPVYWLPTPVPDEQPRINSIDAPDRARPGQQISASIEASPFDTNDHVAVLYANGEPVGRQPVSPRAATVIAFPVPATTVGALQLDAELIDSRTGRSLDALDGGALVNVVAAPRLLVVADGRSPIGESLAAGGWPVTQVETDAFARYEESLAQFGALVLDDVATSDLSAAAWSAISESVRREAMGMLVLGGPNSFGLGAYRESELEALLPVVSEPPEDEKPTSVVFLVDISGSMGRQSGADASLRAAREAVLHAAAALRPEDRVGLIVFDVEARRLLPLSARSDHASAISDVWPGEASGGTSVMPALDLAQTIMADDSSEQQLLLLVTDGMLSSEDLAGLETRLQEQSLEFIAMVLSDKRGAAPLSRAALGDRGSMLLIDDVLRLPALMREEVENFRPALEQDRVVPIVRSPPPILAGTDNWPALDAHLVTRARPEATTMLVAPRGEPLLAAWTAGAGRVVTLTGGLNQWAADWITWSHWPDLVAGLTNYVTVRDPAQTRLRIEDISSNRPSLLVDTGVAQDLPESIAAKLVPPTGAPIEVLLTPDAPGRYRSSVTADQIGRYTLVWESNRDISRHSFLRSQPREPARSGEPVARRYVREGLLNEWGDESAREFARRASPRSGLIFLALLILLATIAAERIPLSRLKQLLRKR